MIKNGLMRQVAKERDEEKKQEKLRSKYKNKELPEQVIIIEKNNMSKFLIKIIGNLFRISAQIIIAFLACCGLLALIYPQSRDILISVVRDVWEQFIYLMKK